MPRPISCVNDAVCSGSGPLCPPPTLEPLDICMPAAAGETVALLGGTAPTAPPGGVSLTFLGTSTWSGEIEVLGTGKGCPPPTGFVLLGSSQPSTSGHTWNIDASAPGYPAPITLCIHYAPSWVLGLEQNIRMLHGTAAPDPTVCNLPGAGWTPLPLAQPIDTVNHVICAYTPSLSPFTLVEPLPTSIPVVAVPAGLVVEATRPAGARVDFTVTAADAQGGPLVPVCTPTSGSTFPIGTTTVGCRATDHDGFLATASFTMTVRDTTGPAFSNVPGTIVAYATAGAGAKVAYARPTATDAVDGARPVTCAPASGSIFAPGKTTVACTASDTHGAASTATFTIWVQVQTATDGTFFLKPIRPDGSSVFRVGRPVPVKFQLVGASAGITNLVARLAVTTVSSTVRGTVEETSDETVDDTDFVFKYRSAQKVYAYRWKTRDQAQGTYRLRVDLGDGVVHQVDVSLKSPH